MADPLDIDKLLEQIAGTDLGASILDFLKQTGKTVDIKQEGPLPESAIANYDTYRTIKIDPVKATETPGRAQTALTHELVHAADSVFASNTYGLPAKNNDPYLVKQLKKFEGPSYDPTRQLIRAATGGSQYRSASAEAMAFGTSNSVKGATPIYPVAHADASQAQEFEIRKDLMLRAMFKQGKNNGN
jgi:hypothetical protein